MLVKLALPYWVLMLLTGGKRLAINLALLLISVLPSRLDGDAELVGAFGLEGEVTGSDDLPFLAAI